MAKKTQYEIGDYVEVKDGGCKGWRGHIETIYPLSPNKLLIFIKDERGRGFGYFQEKQIRLLNADN